MASIYTIKRAANKKISESFLLEYLTDEQRDRFAHIKMTNKARSDTDHFFGPGVDLKREELKGFDGDKSEVHKAVERHLGKEISTDEYKQGLTTDKYNRPVRLGRVIKDENLRNDFANDNTRAGVKSGKNHYVTIVRGTEVAGQTNSAKDKNHPKGHSWSEESCKNVDTGSRRSVLENEIKHGTTLVRVHDQNDQEIYRATLQPHHNDEGHVAYAVDSEYGIKHNSFTKHAHDVAKRLSGAHKGGSFVYEKNRDVYDDNGESQIIHPTISPETVLNDKKTKANTLNIFADRNNKKEHVLAALSHPNADAETTTLAVQHADPEVAMAGIRHPKADTHTASQAVLHPNKDVATAGLNHPEADSRTTVYATWSRHEDIAMAGLHHPKANKNTVDSAANMSSVPKVAVAAVNHPLADKKTLDMAMKNGHEDVVVAALNHPESTADMAYSAAKDGGAKAAWAAVNHPKADKFVYQMAKIHKSPAVAKVASEKLGLTEDTKMKTVQIVKNAAKSAKKKKMSKQDEKQIKDFEEREKAEKGYDEDARRYGMKESAFQMDESDSGLAAKARKSGVSLGILQKVYRRGVAAWNSGHRPGTTPQQWGMARVNSYITKGKGTYYGADKDLREEELLEVAKDKESGLPKKYVSGLSPATAKARAAHWNKMDKLSDRDPAAYEPAPGDATAKTRESKHTIKARKMFEQSVYDARPKQKTDVDVSGRTDGKKINYVYSMRGERLGDSNPVHREFARIRVGDTELAKKEAAVRMRLKAKGNPLKDERMYESFIIEDFSGLKKQVKLGPQSYEKENDTIYHSVYYKGNHIGVIGKSMKQDENEYGRWWYGGNKGSTHINSIDHETKLLNSKTDALKAFISKFDEINEEAENKITSKIVKGIVHINGKPVDHGSIEVDNVDRRDYPDFSDAYISHAEYQDGTKLSDAEMEHLDSNHPEVTHEKAHETFRSGSTKLREELIQILEARKANAKPKDDSGPCWSGYTQYGMKTKRGRSVANCVKDK